LAIELEPGGRVILLPGDSCIDSWGAGTPSVPSGTPPRDAVDDLLRRTVLFKIPHRGSRWAVPSGPGLGRLSSPDLVLLLSVDQAEAARRGWDMPSALALERYRRKARGRLLRTDEGPPEPTEVSSEAEWHDFLGRCDPNLGGLFLEYAV